MRVGLQAPEGARRIAARIDAVPLWLRVILGTLWLAMSVAIMMARDSETAVTVISSAGRSLESAGLSGTTTGALIFIIWSLIPIALYPGAAFLQKHLGPETAWSWLSMPFFGFSVFGHLSRDEAFDVLSASAASAYDLLMNGTLITVFGGIGTYGLFRVVRWLIVDERKARASS